MLLIKNGLVCQNQKIQALDILIDKDTIIDMQEKIENSAAKIIDGQGNFIFPGFEDVHIHLREPGYSYKETIKQGSLACAKGGYTAICTMPNLNPVPDSLENLNQQLAIIERDSCIKIYPYGAITKHQQGLELADMVAMVDKVAGYSDDGKGVQDRNKMIEAMKLANRLGKPLVLHCEDERELHGGYIHQGMYACLNNHKGISSFSEYNMIARDIALAKEYDTHIHICHISCKESVELIRRAKKNGVKITCEVTPHHLILNEFNLVDDGNFKMNPPLRGVDDQKALIEGLLDGTIDCIATDHAPHSKEEKSQGLKDSAFGIIGIEHAFAVLYTKLVLTNIIPLYVLVDKLTRGFEVLRIRADKKSLKVNEKADLCMINLSAPVLINAEEIISTSKNTPFLNEVVYGKVVLTLVNGQIVYNR